MMLAFRIPRRLASWTTPSLWKRFYIPIFGNLHNIKLDKNQVEEVVEAISEAVSSEIETELINASHTNVLLLRQVIPFWLDGKTCFQNAGVWPGWEVAPQPWNRLIRIGEQVIFIHKVNWKEIRHRFWHQGAFGGGQEMGGEWNERCQSETWFFLHENSDEA